MSYIDKDGSNLPISNDDVGCFLFVHNSPVQNLRKALNDRPNMLRITLQNKGESYEEQFGYGLTQKTINQRIKKNLSISSPQEFRRVCLLFYIFITRFKGFFNSGRGHFAHRAAKSATVQKLQQQTSWVLYPEHAILPVDFPGPDHDKRYLHRKTYAEGTRCVDQYSAGER